MNRFETFSNQHLVTLAIGGIATLALLLMGRMHGKWRKVSTALLAFFNLAAYPLSQAAWQTTGMKTNLDNLIPFHLCDIASITAGFALLTRRPLLMALTYYWGLAATIQALATPALETAFPSWLFVMFFIQHFIIVAAALHMPMVEGWRPEKPFFKSPFQAYLWSLGYLLTALGVNHLLGTNFGFANRPPENPSLIDYLGPWPWYLLSFNVLCFALFSLLTLPFLGRLRKNPQIAN
ncbi:MAG: TIGR02206 family membrane protein [Verrucomicrobiota bacterium]